MNAWAEPIFHCVPAPWSTRGHRHPQTSRSVPDTSWAVTLTKDPPFLTQNGYSVVCVGRHLSAW